MRDATDFIPTLKKPWWEELPEAHEGAWAARAARRKGRCDFRLAFIPSKYRLGPEPELFCLELQLEGGGPWTLEDVTHKLQEAGEAARDEADRAHKARIQLAAEELLALVIERDKAGRPVLKTEAETFLSKGQDITQREARQVIKDHNDTLWVITPGPRGRGKGPAQILIPLKDASYTPKDDNRINDAREQISEKGSRGAYFVVLDGSERQNRQPSSPCATSPTEDPLFCRHSKGIEEPISTEHEEGAL